MTTITVEVPSDVADALAHQARALLMTRRLYVRAVLAAVAAQAERARANSREEVEHAQPDD